MKFRDQFPDYQAYSNDGYLMNELTHSLLKALSYKIPLLLIELGKTRRGLDLDGTFRNMCDILSRHTNNDKTINWGWNYIIRDFEGQFLDFQKLKFYKFMDCIVELTPFALSPVEEYNDIFEEHNFGYRLTNDSEKPWVCINPSVGMAVQIDDVIESTKEVCMQTAAHIKQAKEQLTRATDPRARKDAIRDCLSATEALMRKLTDTKSIDEADRYMRADRDIWGPKVIVSEGIKLWKLFHEDYTDIRHGDFNISEITYEEAIYFVDRILAFVKYISSHAIDEQETELIF